MTGTDASPNIPLASRGGIPFALIARDAATVEMLTGDVVDVELLADIPLTDAGGTPRRCWRSCRSGRCASADSSAATTELRCAA